MFCKRCSLGCQPLTCGITKGTILGSLLFILCQIVSLIHILECMQKIYTHLTFSSNDVMDLEESMNDELIKISEWLHTNKLTRNKFKTEFMLIGSWQTLGTFNRTRY